jgi:hypothetical protein
VSGVLVHIALVLLMGTAIVTLGTFYSDADDGRARQVWPRRMLGFFGGCLVLVVVMLVCEHTFASLG